METKNQSQKVLRIKRKLKFQNSFIVDPAGTAGGLAIFWDDQVNIYIDSSSANAINAQCQIKATQQRMQLTFIHAPNEFKERVLLWEAIYRESLQYQQPWLCLGDFNEILYNWEKVGKHRAETYRLIAFRDFIQRYSLMDLESKGCAFTWTNNREGDQLVKKRLDRALCTATWRTIYPIAESIALPPIGSDHSPILVSLNLQRKKRAQRFKYEAFWAEEEECTQVVKKIWADPSTQQPIVVEKLQITANKLMKWSKNRFSNAKMRLAWLTNELQTLMNRTAKLQKSAAAKKITQEIEQLWRQEEMYWGMRSKIRWLKWGDRNSKFFHATII